MAGLDGGGTPSWGRVPQGCPLTPLVRQSVHRKEITSKMKKRFKLKTIVEGRRPQK